MVVLRTYDGKYREYESMQDLTRRDIQLADAVINLDTGKIIKNRYGPKDQLDPETLARLEIQ